MAELAIQKTNNEASAFLKTFGKSLHDYAIRDYSQTAFLKSAMIAIVNNPELSKAMSTEQGKESIFNALRYAATTGLSLNPQEGKSALIGYYSKDKGYVISYQIMKNGMIDLALESGNVEFLTTEYVRENDEFKLKKSVHGDEYDFSPALKDRGAILGFFAALKLKTGATNVLWMTAEEIKEHRQKYSSKTQMPEIGYGQKTVMKALLRNISISPDLDNAIGADDFFEAEFTVENKPAGKSANEVLDKIQEEPEKVEPNNTGGKSLL